ncbi:MAG TPA: membrane protein insertase YidC [Fimbriimonadaceae bacterium]
MMSTIMLMIALFLGVNLMCNKQSTQEDPRTEAQIVTAIQQQAGVVRSTAAKDHITISDAVKALKESTLKSDSITDLISPHPQLSAKEDLDQMHLLDDLGMDFSIRGVEGAYETQIDAIKGMSVADKQDLKIKAQMVEMHTLIVAAAERHEMQRVVSAAGILMPLERGYDSKPIWQQPVPVASTKLYPASLATPAQLTNDLNTLSTELGKSSPVWGFFPGYQFVDWVVHLTGANSGLSYWLTALLMAFFVRGVIYPVSQRQMMWSRKMQQLTPLVNEIKAEYKNKPNQTAAQQEISQRTMALYKEYGMNPLAGCVPAFIQMPLFLLVYDSMLNYRFEFQKGTFLWINPSTSALSHGFFARNLGEKDYVLIIIYAISMVTTALLTPVTDPTNMKQQRIMGVSVSGFFGIMMFFWPVPSAFILYWIFTNILATAQSLRSYRLPLPPLVKVNAPNGGVYPIAGTIPGPSKEGKLNGAATNGTLNGKPKSTGTPKIHKPRKKK